MDTEYNEQAKNQVAWNLSNALVTEIQSLLLSATATYNRGRMTQAFFYMKSVKLRFIQSLSIIERENLNKIEIRFHKANFGNVEKGFKNKLSNLGFIYEIYTIQIMDLLNAYGYLIPTKKEATGI